MSVKVTIPEELEMAITRLRARENLSWQEACNRASMILADFEQAVESGAQRIYKSRFMTEMNKARRSIFNQGYMKGVEEYRVWFFCAKCGGEITLKPKSKAHYDVIKYLREKGWKHAQCPKP